MLKQECIVLCNILNVEIGLRSVCIKYFRTAHVLAFRVHAHVVCPTLICIDKEKAACSTIIYSNIVKGFSTCNNAGFSPVGKFPGFQLVGIQEAPFP